MKDLIQNKPFYSKFSFEILAKDLEKQSWSQVEGAFSPDFCDALKRYFVQLKRIQVFKKAKIGKTTQKNLREDIRNSKICWVENWDQTRELSQFNGFLMALQNQLNKYFMLSLKRYETQFAYYPVGGFYKKHLDQLHKSKHRQITSTLYLEDSVRGGELVVYNKKDIEKIDKIILPKKGSFVTLISKDIYHEVLKTDFERHSLTTWFRDDAVILY